MAWYNYDRINSYNACFNFILTNRGYGKSYGIKKQCIKRFLKTGEQFVYCRRYKTEIKEFPKFFDDMREVFKGHELTVKGKVAYCDGAICGYAIPLSVSQNFKSVPFPLVTTIIFDEFITDSKFSGYMPNEVECFLDLFETVARKRDNVKAYFLANNISVVNPYFVYFNVYPRENERFTLARDGELVIDISTNDEFIKEKKETRFGKLIKGTKYSDYSIDNKSLRDSDTFVEKMSLKSCTPVCSFTLDEQTVMIWFNMDKCLYYCNDKLDRTAENFSLSVDDHNDNSYLNARVLKFGAFNEVIKYFQLGKVRFSSQLVKQNMYSIFKKLGVS